MMLVKVLFLIKPNNFKRLPPPPLIYKPENIFQTFFPLQKELFVVLLYSNHCVVSRSRMQISCGSSILRTNLAKPQTLCLLVVFVLTAW